MARGFGAVKTAAKDISERKNSGSSYQQKRYLRVADGEAAVVRFLEQGDSVVSGWFHEVPNGRKVPSLIPCIDQDPETGEKVGKDCPGCEENMKRKFKTVLNLIWRDAPVFAVDNEGKTDWNKVVGHEDTVVLWQPGIEVSEELHMIDEDFGGLSSRDFKIRRRGNGLDTKYSINPADPSGGATDLSEADKELEAEKFDLNEIISAPAYDVWGVRSAPTEKTEYRTSSDASPFMKKRG